MGRRASLARGAGWIVLLVAPIATPVTAEEPAEGAWQILSEHFRGTRGGRELGELVDVTIVHDSLRVTAARGRWNHATEVAELGGDVRLVEGASTVRCDSLIYFRSIALARLFGRVRARDGAFRAEADSAHVHRLEERAVLFGNARIVDEGGDVLAQRIDYDRLSGVAVATGDVRAADDDAGSVVEGERLVYNAETQLAIVTGEPRLTTSADDDALVVEAEELRLDRARAVAEAFRDVRIRQGVMRARAGRGTFDRRGGWARLLERPVAWDREGRITADTLTVAFEAGEMRRLDALGDVSILRASTEGPRAGERLRASGRAAVGFFTAGAMDSIHVVGDAVSDLVPSRADLARGSGVNHAQADTMRVYFRDGRAARVHLVGESTGRYWFPPGAKGPAPSDTTRAASQDSVVALDREPAEIDGPALLSASGLLAAEADTSAAPPDSAAADRVAWIRRVESLDALAPPDSLFPGGIDQVTYGGRSVVYEIEGGDIELVREAQVQYGDARLRAGRIVFDTTDETLAATEAPSLTDPGGELTGSRMSYDVKTREGVVWSGRTEMEGAYYFGRRIKRLDDRTLLGEQCSYTTCDRPDPHFHFQAPEMKIRLRDKVVARPVVLYVANIPILAAPFFLFPTERGRRSGVLTPHLEIRFSDLRGRSVRALGYYWAISDYADLTTWVDYYERNPRWIGHFETRFVKRYAYQGSFRGTYELEQPERLSSPDTPTTEGRRWEVAARHSHDLSPNATLRLNADLRSDLRIRRDQQFGFDYEEQVDRQAGSDASFSRRWDGASLTLSASRDQDLDPEPGQTEVRWNAPSLAFSLSRRTIGRRPVGRSGGFLPFLASTGWSYSLRAVQPIVEIAGGSTSRDFALTHQIGLSDTRRVGPVNVSPRFDYSEFLFEEDNLGRRWQRAGRWSAGVSANTTVYGTAPGMGPVVGFRHVLQPSVGFSFQPAVTGARFVDGNGQSQPVFPSVGGISFGGASRSRRLNVSARNELQAKVRGEEEDRRLNLATLTLGTSYDLDADTRPWGPLSSRLDIQPLGAFNTDLATSHDLNDFALTSLSINSNMSFSGTTASPVPAGTEFFGDANAAEGPTEGLVDRRTRAVPGQPWRVTLAHTYSRGRDAANFNSTLRANLSLSLTPRWQISYSANANLREKEIQTQRFSIYRDLHCWDARFERTLSPDGGSYYFRIGVKGIDEIKYEESGF